MALMQGLLQLLLSFLVGSTRNKLLLSFGDVSLEDILSFDNHSDVIFESDGVIVVFFCLEPKFFGDFILKLS